MYDAWSYSCISIANMQVRATFVRVYRTISGVCPDPVSWTVQLNSDCQTLISTRLKRQKCNQMEILTLICSFSPYHLLQSQTSPWKCNFSKPRWRVIGPKQDCLGNIASLMNWKKSTQKGLIPEPTTPQNFRLPFMGQLNFMHTLGLSSSVQVLH
jgi:hypothetical protein